MKLIIDIPDNYKQRLDEDFDNLNTGSIGCTAILMAVKEGIPLPKGHGRLIDANKVDTAIYECFDGIQFYDGTGFDIYSDSKESIDKIPTIIEADKKSKE